MKVKFMQIFLVKVDHGKLELVKAVRDQFDKKRALPFKVGPKEW